MHSAIRREIDWPTMVALIAVAAVSIPAFAQDEKVETPTSQASAPSSPLAERSPWLLTPVASSNPKLGTSFGGLAGYLHLFDAKSRPSIFALSGQYSSTDSIVAAAVGHLA